MPCQRARKSLGRKRRFLSGAKGMFSRFLVALSVLAATFVASVSPVCAQTQTLGVGRDWNTTRSQFAIMYDVQAANPITITNVTAGTFIDGPFELYGRPGTHVGFEGSSAGWTSLGTVTITTDGVDSLVFPVNIPLDAGQTYAFYITSLSGGRVGTTSSMAVGNVAASDANLTIFDGTTHVSTPFNPVGPPAPNRPVGSIGYSLGLPAAVPTLSEWAMIGFGVLLAGFALLSIRRLYAV